MCIHTLTMATILVNFTDKVSREDLRASSDMFAIVDFSDVADVCTEDIPKTCSIVFRRCSFAPDTVISTVRGNVTFHDCLSGYPEVNNCESVHVVGHKDDFSMLKGERFCFVESTCMTEEIFHDISEDESVDL